MINIAPAICINVGISLNKNIANIADTTGSHSFDADTKEGEKYFKHQEKMLWPKMVENIANRSPTTGALMP